LIAEANELSVSLFGTNIDVSDSSPLGKINQTTRAEMAVYWEKLNNAYLAAFIDSATGDNLDKVVEPISVLRKQNKASTGYVAFIGTEGTIVPGSTVVKTATDPTIAFTTDSSLILSNEVINGEFTTNTTGWTAENAATLASVVAGADGNCLQITCDGTNDPYAKQIISVDEHHFYDLSVLAKAGTAASYRVKVYDESNSTDIYDSGILTESVGDWSTQVYERIEIPNDCTSVSIHLIHVATAGDATTLLFDTCKLTHVSSAVTAVVGGISGNIVAGNVNTLGSPVSGITSVTNPNDMTGGVEKETDVQLRTRAKLSIGAGGKATMNAVLARLLAVDNVSSVSIEENDTNIDYIDMVANSGFDTDVSSWSGIYAAVLASVAGGKTGNCLQITGGGTHNNPYAYQAVPVVPGDNYTFTVYVKAGTEATYNVRLYDVSNSAFIYQSADLEETAGDWSTHVTKTFTAPPGCTEVGIELCQVALSAATTTLFFDTVILNGLPPHSIRACVNGGTDNDIAQALLDSVAAGIETYGDESGTGSLENGQSFTRYFSRPDEILIYVNAAITSDDTYAGDEAVETAIINYLGGTDAESITHTGLCAGDDVIFYEIVSAIMDVEGVTNAVVTSGVVSPPVGTSDIVISPIELAYASTASVVIS